MVERVYSINGKGSNDFIEQLRSNFEGNSNRENFEHVVTAGDYADVYHVGNITLALLKDMERNYRLKMCGNLINVEGIKGKLESIFEIKLEAMKVE